MKVTEGMARHQGDGEAGDDRSHRPQPRGRTPSELWREVAHESERRDEDDALDEAEEAVERGVDPQVGGIGQAEQHHQCRDEEPIGDQVGAAPTIRQPGDQEGERPDEVADDDDVDEERPRHPESAMIDGVTAAGT
jgi:hypothetical protein